MKTSQKLFTSMNQLYKYILQLMKTSEYAGKALITGKYQNKVKYLPVIKKRNYTGPDKIF